MARVYADSISLSVPPGVGGEINEKIQRVTFSNPCLEQLTVKYAYNNSTDLRIATYDIQGRRINKVRKQNLVGSGFLTIDFSNIPEGVYLLHIREGSYEHVEKLIHLR